jgi:hypothetical protein
MEKLIIGFGSKRLSGKDTAANFMSALMTSRGYQVRRDSFASTLKDVCRVVFGFSTEQMNDPEQKIIEDEFWGFTPRWAMQRVGTEAFREQIQQDIWVKCLARRFLQDERSVVVSDLRFENEARAIQGLGGFVIRMDRRIEFDEVQDTHLSELGLDRFQDWNYIIDNNYSLDDLEKALAGILHEIMLQTQE